MLILFSISVISQESTGNNKLNQFAAVPMPYHTCTDENVFISFSDPFLFTVQNLYFCILNITRFICLSKLFPVTDSRVFKSEIDLL